MIPSKLRLTQRRVLSRSCLFSLEIAWTFWTHPKRSFHHGLYLLLLSFPEEKTYSVKNTSICWLCYFMEGISIWEALFPSILLLKMRQLAFNSTFYDPFWMFKCLITRIFQFTFIWSDSNSCPSFFIIVSNSSIGNDYMIFIIFVLIIQCHFDK